MLANKVILITGAFSGIGKAVTELFMQSRNRVVGVGRNQTNKVPSYASNYLPIVRNIKTELDAEEIIEFALEKFNQIDIIIHCAGKGLIKNALELKRPDFDKMMQDNFYTACMVTQAALPHMIERNEGTILFIPGVLGARTMAGGAAYSASKYALVGYAKSLREDLKKTKIKSTVLFLGGVNSEFWDDIDLQVQRDKMITVQDAARMVWFAAQQPDSGVMAEMVLQPYNHQLI